MKFKSVLTDVLVKKRWQIFAVFFIASVALTVSGIFPATISKFFFQDSAQALVDTSQHPYLLFTSNDLVAMRTQALTPGTKRAEIYNSLKILVDSRGNAPSQALPAVSLVYLISQDSKYLTWVKNTMSAMSGWPNWGSEDLSKGDQVFNFAIAYDMVYNSLSAGERTAYRNVLARELSKINATATSPVTDSNNWWKSAYLQNHLHHSMSALGMGSLAIIREGNLITNGYNQNDVDQWLATSKDKIAKAMFLMNNMEGGWHEGWSYQRFMMERLPEVLYALDRVEGVNHFSAGFGKVADYYLYNARPDNSKPPFMNFAEITGDYWINPLDLMRLVARQYRNGSAQWLADQYARDFGRTGSIDIVDYKRFAFEFIYYDSSVSPIPPNASSLYYDENDLGVSIMKSHWGSSALVAGLKSGYYGGKFAFEKAKTNWCWDPAVCGGTTYYTGAGDYPQDFYFYASHEHPDQNAFYLFGNGQWLFPEAPGYDTTHGDPWGKTTRAHNTILVGNRGQIGEDNATTWQIGAGPNSWDEEPLLFWKHQASITEKSHTNNYDYVIGDAAKAYPSTLGLTEFKRNIIFIKSGYAVVFDKLNAVSSTPYDWRGHALDGAYQEGNWIRGVSKNGQLLGTYVLSPSGYSFSSGIETVGAPATSSTYDLLKFIDPDRQIYFFNLRKSGTDVRFITVLYPSNTTTWGSKPTITSLGEDSQKAGVKVQFSDGSRDYILSTYGTIGDVGLGTGGDTFNYNGKAATIRRDAGGGLKSLFMTKGTYLQQGGVDLIRTSNSNMVMDAVYSGTNVDVSGENISDFTLYAPGSTSLTINGASANFTRNGNYIIYPETGPQPFSLTISNVNMPSIVQKDQPFNIAVTVNVSGEPEAGYRGIFVKATDSVSGICERVGSTQTGCSTGNSDPFWNGTKTYTINFPGLAAEGAHSFTIESAIDVSLAPDIVTDVRIVNINVQGEQPILPGLSWEAEEGMIALPFVINGGNVYQTNETIDPSAGGRASYRFRIDNAGDYTIKAIVNAGGEASNSLFLNIDSEPTTPNMIWDIPVTNGPEEREASWRGSGSAANNEFVPKIFSLSAGIHELIIRGREANTSMDRITVAPMAQGVVPETASGWGWFGADCTDPTEATCGIKTDPIGWISFNSTNTEISCIGTPYGVDIDPATGDISGAAWIGVGENNDYTDCNNTEDSVGWLSFDYSGTDWPAGISPSYDFPAKIVNSEIQGWAPIISRDLNGVESTLSWVRFKGLNYSVKINSDGTIGTTGQTDYYGWSNSSADGGLGWIDFSKVVLSSINGPPEARNLAVAVGEYCGAPYPPIYLSWDFFDLDLGDSQSAYHVQIDNNLDFSSPEVDTGKVISSSGTAAPINLSYDDTFYWQVRVWDNEGAFSDWVDGSSFTTAKHQYPAVDFNVQPQIPKLNQNTLFADQSIAFGGATKNAWLWDFQDGLPVSSIQQNPTMQFKSVGRKTVSLTVTDSDNYSCSGSKSINVETASPAPQWKETAPISYLNYLLANILILSKETLSVILWSKLLLIIN